MAKSATRPIPEFVETDFLRFWKKVQPSKDLSPSRCCWEWKGKLNSQGYAIFSMGRQSFHASRVAWAMMNGVQPPLELDMRHDCDNPRCIRPSHLAPGTRAQNVADMIARSRHRPRPMSGEANPKATLTTEKVHLIRRLWAEGKSKAVITRTLGVGRGAIEGVIQGVTWTHVPYEPGVYDQTVRRTALPREGMRGERHPAAVLNVDDVLAVRKALAEGESQSSLARKYDVTSGAISNIARRKSWGHLV